MRIFNSSVGCKEFGKKAEAKLAVSSSVHQLIKSKEQAAMFMKLLREA